MLAAAGFAESVERMTQEREVSGAGLLGILEYLRNKGTFFAM